MDERHIVAIDLGTSKFALTVAKIEDENIHIIYYKETPAEGMSYSRILNPTKAGKVLKKAIAEAESELGVKILQVIIGKPKYEVKQEMANMTLKRSPEECITEEEISNMKDMAIDTYPLDNPENEALYGAIAQSFSNGEEFQLVEDEIIGMASKEIEGNFKLFIGRRSALDNIEIAFKDSGVCVARQYFTPDSTAKAVLYDSEMDNGVALVDFGAGATSVSVYYGNVMRHYASIPFGGNTITKDIKSECSISGRLAENIKLGFGACMPDKLQNMSEKIINIVSNSGSMTKKLSVKYLSEIITARTQEIIEAILYEIQKSGLADKLKNGIVVTGGGVEMTNCTNFIKDISGYSVRTGYPKKMFSATGCDGIYESSATVSVGMILKGKQEKINCILPSDSSLGDIEIKNDEEEVPVSPHDTEESAETAEAPGKLFPDDGQEKTGHKADEGKKTARHNPTHPPKQPKQPKQPPIWVKIGNLFEDYYDRISKDIDNDRL